MLTAVGNAVGVIGFRSPMLAQPPRRSDRAAPDCEHAATEAESADPASDRAPDVHPSPAKAIPVPLTSLAARFR